jgi:uncharacterized membrane protein
MKTSKSRLMVLMAMAAALLISSLVLSWNDGEQRAVGSHTADMTILRWVRGFFGLIAGWQVVGLLPLLGWLGSLDQVTGENLAQVFIKLVVLLVAYGIFVGMKKLINWIHSRRFGEPTQRW